MWIRFLFSCVESTISLEGHGSSSGDPKPFIEACNTQEEAALLLMEATKEHSCQAAWDRLSSIERIDISKVAISELSIFSGMTNLKVFTAYENGIQDISPLQSLDRMEELYLVSNQISDISSLVQLQQLQVLRLDGNKVKDISILPKLKRLNRLGLDSNQIEDFTPIAQLDAIQALNTNYNPVNPNLCPVESDGPKQLHKYCKRMHKHYCATWSKEHKSCKNTPKICIPYCSK